MSDTPRLSVADIDPVHFHCAPLQETVRETAGGKPLEARRAAKAEQMRWLEEVGGPGCWTRERGWHQLGPELCASDEGWGALTESNAVMPVTSICDGEIVEPSQRRERSGRRETSTGKRAVPRMAGSNHGERSGRNERALK